MHQLVLDAMFDMAAAAFAIGVVVIIIIKFVWLFPRSVLAVCLLVQQRSLAAFKACKF